MGSTREEIRAQAARGDLADALGRLDACGADGELVGLARDCLAAERERRPRNAGEVARRLTAYLAGVQERLKAAELARVEAQTRAEEAQARADGSSGPGGGGPWRWRHRCWSPPAWSAAAGLTWRGSGRNGRRCSISLGRGRGPVREAERAGDDLARWLTARDAAHAVEGLLTDAPDESDPKARDRRWSET